jgi:hypothetical protein
LAFCTASIANARIALAILLVDRIGVMIILIKDEAGTRKHARFRKASYFTRVTQRDKI